MALTATAGGAESAKGNVGSKTVSTAAASLQVVEPTAYKLDLGYANQLKVRAIGTVPLGTQCTPFTAMNLNVIAYRQLAVLPAGTARPLQVFAKCQ